MHRQRVSVVALALALLAPSASAELWRWQDAAGTVRYTPDPGRVPSSRRGSLVRVEPGMPPIATPAPAAPAATASPPLYAPADEFSFASDPFNAPEQARTLRGEEVPEPAGEPPSASAAAAGPAGIAGAANAAAVAPVAAAPPALTPTQRDRKAELEAQILRDEEALKTLISSAAADAGEPSDELREIARRLPELQAELRALEAAGSDANAP